MHIKLSIISAGALPIPAVYGGGVETLIQYFIDQNEIYNNFDITIYTLTGAEKYQEQYKYTKFINISRNIRKDWIIKYLNPILYGINRRIIRNVRLKILDSYEKKVINLLKKDTSDLVLLENNLSILLRKSCLTSKIIFHAHYDDLRPGISGFEEKRFKWCYSKINANISVSSFIENRIKDIIGNGTQYYVVRNCIDTNLYLRPSLEDVIKKKADYGIPQGCPVVMYVGRLTEEKGVKQLIEAFSLIKAKACLVIVGGINYSDDTTNEYLELIKRLAKDCKNPVIFTGYVDHSSIPIMWCLSDIAVVPTYDVEEAAGLVVVEAMASKSALIISDSGAMQEYASNDAAVTIKRGEDFVIELAEAIEKLCNNKDKRIQLGEAGQRCAFRYDATTYYHCLSRVLQEVFKEKRI